MDSRYKSNDSNISLIEAVETLSSIADLEIDKQVGISEEHELTIHDKKITYKTVHWLHKQDAEKTVEVVKETFRVILNYLRNFYKKEYSYVTDQKAIEGIKTIMVLVGEAAKKLDRYTTLFHETKGKSIQQLTEYKKLQEFYLTHIDRKIDEGVLGKWILALSQRSLARKREVKLIGKVPTETRHVFVDLESVKKDTEYELFFIRKEDGSRFFNPRLIRNIKLVCDFGDFFGQTQDSDPLIDLNIWQDRSMQSTAKSILKSVDRKLINSFYQEAYKYKERDLISALHNTLMALMLGSNPRNLMKDVAMKSSYAYFLDFLKFLRESLASDEYHNLVAHPKKTNKVGRLLINITHTLCRALYTSIHRFQEFDSMVKSLINQGNSAGSSEHTESVKASNQLWTHIANDYASMLKLYKRHPNGPLEKVLKILQDGTYQAFEPFSQLNLPNILFSLQYDENPIINMHLPSPTYQEYINKVNIIEPFKAFLRSCQKDSNIHKHLLINLQDRTSWREHSRCKVLENLPTLDGFKDTLVEVTLAKDTEFYHQLPPYHQDNHTEVFLQNFKEHLGDETSGYYLSSDLKKAIIGSFSNGILDAIHKVFFTNKNILLREHRLDFIEIFDLFLTLKLIDIVKPDSMSLTCKDGVDLGASSNGLLYAFVKMLSQDGFKENDWQQFNRLIYTPSLIVRERLIVSERFNRMLNALKTIEYAYSEHGQKEFAKLIQDTFGQYYKASLLNISI